MLGRYGIFAGGIDLPDEKHATVDSPIEACRPLERVRVPLQAAWRAAEGQAPAQPLVEPGQKVQAGQKIARGAGSESLDVRAPLDGTVSAITQASIASAGAFAACPAIEIVDLPAAQLPQMGRRSQWQELAPQALRELLESCPVVVHRPGGTTIPRFIDLAIKRRCRRLIANVIEDQPYITASHRLLVEHGHAVLTGLAILGRAMQAARVVLAVDERRVGDYGRLVRPAKLFDIERLALPPKYPMGVDALLVKVLSRREAPVGGSTMDVGAAVVDAATCLAVCQFVATSQSPLGRVVTLAGPRMHKPANVWAPFGAMCSDLAAAPGALVHGGPMTGLLCPPDAVVTPATDAVLALDMEPAPAGPSACIRCSWCTDHCPSRLNVVAINDAFELGRPQRAARLGSQACMECGVCSYICPSRLPLCQRVKTIKRLLASSRTT